MRYSLPIADHTAVPAVMRYTLISRQDLIDSLLADSTVPCNSGNRCKLKPIQPIALPQSLYWVAVEYSINT